MTSIPPSSSAAAASDCRQNRLRGFMKRYDIRLPDVAEQLAGVARQANHDAAETFSPQRVHNILYRNAFMPKLFRDHLLNLGFPEEALPPQKPVARFPGLQHGGDTTAQQPAA